MGLILNIKTFYNFRGKGKNGMNSNIKYFTKPKFPDFDYLVSHVN